ncbi:nuclease-related domain-containing protein [Bhargavaea beijingensis]|uniref:nuclease-related domain-containing protein n=1 Tax=Bhargavaea beijingensis TaxID=426756 RepID=UPI00222445F1|nr:nuclease-related domain-containing protein [Bhargavaea beijingensis]MCW1928147.1 NERD domain-containing protein [Bhargavaea beijingensis]
MEERNYPLYLYAAERMLPRMAEQDPKYIEVENEITTTRIGYEGETRSDQMIRRACLPRHSRVLHDLTIRVFGEDPVLIDTLVITKHFAFIIEVKNISGTLELERHPALLKRTAKDGKVSYFQSPFVQLNMAIDTVAYWLLAQNIEIPVKGAVFLASKYAEPHFEPGMPIHFIREIPDLFRNELKNHPPAIDEAAVEWIASALRYQEEPYDHFPLVQHFNHTQDNLHTEPLCTECLGRLETHTKRMGTCMKCELRQWIPYTETLVDYFLIYCKKASLTECSNFINLGRSKTAELLKSPLFLRHGKTNNTVFELNRPNIRISREGKLIVPGDEKVK